jgi:hypothetical protein
MFMRAIRAYERVAFKQGVAGGNVVSPTPTAFSNSSSSTRSCLRAHRVNCPAHFQTNERVVPTI